MYIPKHIKKIAIALGATAVAGGAVLGTDVFTEEPTITLENPQVITWEKPTTDAEWAEDVKKESLHLKSTEVLMQMRSSHAGKLDEIKESGKRIVECEACVRYEIRQDLLSRQAQGEDIQDIDLSVENEYQNQRTQYLYDIEKLTQSIERMDKELELRKKGFVVPNKEKDGKINNTSKVDAEYVRIIND